MEKYCPEEPCDKIHIWYKTKFSEFSIMENSLDFGLFFWNNSIYFVWSVNKMIIKSSTNSVGPFVTFEKFYYFWTKDES